MLEETQGEKMARNFWINVLLASSIYLNLSMTFTKASKEIGITWPKKRAGMLEFITWVWEKVTGIYK